MGCGASLKDTPVASAKQDASASASSTAMSVVPADGRLASAPPASSSTAPNTGALSPGDVATGTPLPADGVVDVGTEVRPAQYPTLPSSAPPWKNNAVTLQVFPAENMDDLEIPDGGERDVPVLIRVKSPEVGERSPSCFCCVLDVSGSMGMEATITGTGGAQETHGLSLLDVAKHGVRTIINSLNQQDQLAIVSFNQEASTVLELTVMDEAGRKLAEDRLDALHAGGRTNLWAGLARGLDALRNNKLSGAFSHIMLLSDGASSGKDTIVPNLLEYMNKSEVLGSINTFGFGYAIDSSLLVQLAGIGNGSYGFIPDAGFIGTVFVNCISNLLVTFARDVSLMLEPHNGATVSEVCGGQEVIDTTEGHTVVKVGMLRYQQSKDIVVSMRVKAAGHYLVVSGSMQQLDRTGFVAGGLSDINGSMVGNKAEVLPHVIRCRVVDSIRAALFSGALNRTASMQSLASSSTTASAAEGATASSSTTSGTAAPPSGISGLFSKMKSQFSMRSSSSSLAQSPPVRAAPPPVKQYYQYQDQASIAQHRQDTWKAAKDMVEKLLEQMKEDIRLAPELEVGFVKALFEDVNGQVSEAVSCIEFFLKWGRHYLPSLMFAHQLQLCNNFKDPGVQFYGGSLFEDLRDMADDIFCKLPPPKATAASSTRSSVFVHSATLAAQPAAAPPISMNVYNDRFSG